MNIKFFNFVFPFQFNILLLHFVANSKTETMQIKKKWMKSKVSFFSDRKYEIDHLIHLNIFKGNKKVKNNSFILTLPKIQLKDDGIV